MDQWVHQRQSGCQSRNEGSLPLAEARVEVKENPEAPGSYSAIAYMRPWLQMEELTASLRMVADIPSSS